MLLFYTKVITSGCAQHNLQGVSDIGSRVGGATGHKQVCTWVAAVGGLFLSRCTHSQGIHAPLSYLTVPYNFQILTSSPDLPVLRLFPLQTYVHGPQCKAPLGRDCGSPASFPLPTLHFPNSLPGLSLLNEARACASHSQELHAGNLTYETFYLSISTQDPTGKFEFNKPLSQFTGFAPLPPPECYRLLSSDPAAPARLLPLPCPFSPLRRKPGHLPVHLPPDPPSNP